ncbi:Uncharacterised protein [uncultured archaeon]|nr:Uncharacterised protein [uncultured archaeon]
MDIFKKSVRVLCLFFLIFATLIGSFTAVANLIFMLLCYFFRDSLRFIFRTKIKDKFLLLVTFGTLLGLALETVWYFGLLLENKSQQWVSLLDDFIRMFPVYFILFVLLYQLVKRYPFTERQAFIYGGTIGYIYYFIMEGLQINFSPLPLLILWEINNFLLNGFLIWMPLYISNNLVNERERSVKKHIWVGIFLLGMVIAAIAISIIFLSVLEYKPVKLGP